MRHVINKLYKSFYATTSKKYTRFLDNNDCDIAALTFLRFQLSFYFGEIRNREPSYSVACQRGVCARLQPHTARNATRIAATKRNMGKVIDSAGPQVSNTRTREAVL